MFFITSDSITNFSLQDSLGFSKKTSSFFRKETFKDFFFLNNGDSNNVLNSLVKKNSNELIWDKTFFFKKQNDSNAQVTSSNNKYIYKPQSIANSNSNYECLFSRKCKNFNKGRYSRNRQVYRTGVYMCFYINIIALYSLWFYFYKFKFKFTYFWWVFILLPFSFINARALKYNLYFPKYFLYHLNSYINWFLFFVKRK